MAHTRATETSVGTRLHGSRSEKGERSAENGAGVGMEATYRLENSDETGGVAHALAAASAERVKITPSAKPYKQKRA